MLTFFITLICGVVILVIMDGLFKTIIEIHNHMKRLGEKLEEDETDPFLDIQNCVNRLYDDYLKHGKIIIAYDYDNTVHDYHEQDTQYTQVSNLLNKFRGYAKFIVYTCKEDTPELRKSLTEKGLPFDTINQNILPQYSNNNKLYYNILLDDRAGLPSAYETLLQTYHLITVMAVPSDFF
jgi:hypothetical protein